MIRKADFINKVWQTPLLPPIPAQLEGNSCSNLCLTNRIKNEWQFLFEEIKDIPSPFAKSQDYDFNTVDEIKWEEIIVPSSLIMQGYDIQNNVEYYYRRKITIPKEYAQNRVFLRFEGVYSNARIWVNNQYIRTHVGGFTSWDCDITAFAQEEEVTLIVGVADIEGDHPGVWNPNGQVISDSAWASYYAHHNIGGILRDITLYALPKNYIARTHIDTILDDAYNDAVLKIDLQLYTNNEPIQIKAELLDEHNQLMVSEIHSIDLSYLDTWIFPKDQLIMHPDENWKAENQEAYENDRKFEARYIDQYSDKPYECNTYSVCLEMDVEGAKLWDAEHPHLYKVKISLWDGHVMLQENHHKVGFRQICYGGMRHTDANKVYINGHEIKLRGVCRHDVSHLYGRSLTKEDIRNEILAYKKNNINHIRTSHYPASQYLLDVCDELGIYVEQENSACFKGDNGYDIYNPPQDFVNSFAEMIESSRNHPSVIIWSLANESGFERTYAFRTEYDYVKIEDPTRPVIFSYPYTVKSNPVPYDLYSQHYASVTGLLGNDKMPILHDEFAHVACYNLEDLIRDNSCREAWGESIKKGWENIFKTDGALGCAIWGGIDDVFYIPEGTSESHQHHSKGKAAGYGEWGAVLDAYKREKPEAYLTKKAFSPIRLDADRSTLGKDIILYLRNWFDHTSLKEVKMICTDENGDLLYDGFIQEDIPPHQDGVIKLLGANVQGNSINVSFYYNDLLIDAYHLTQVVSVDSLTEISLKQSFEIVENRDKVSINTPSASLYFDKHTGKASYCKSGQMDPAVTGPYLYMNEQEVAVVQTEEVIYQIENGLAVMTLRERYDNLSGAYIKMIFDGVDLHTFISILDDDTKLEQVEQLGVRYRLLDKVEAISWHRKGLYCTYPEHHIGRNEGTAYLRRCNSDMLKDEYGVKPEWCWEQDMANYFLFEDKSKGITNDFRTRRNHIQDYTVHFVDGSNLCVTPINSHLGAFVEYDTINEKLIPHLQIALGDYYPKLAWGNYCGEPLDIPQENTLDFKLVLCNL